MSTRLWRVTGVLSLIAIEALLYGFTYPFFSLALEKYGLASWLIGLNASLAGAGIFIVGPFLPKLIDRVGIKVVVAGQFAISLLSFVAMLMSDNLIVWFAARFVMGTCFSTLWTTTEIWLNGVVDNRHRGRIIGASGTLYAAFQFAGPLLLGWTGVTGPLPLLAAILPLAVGIAVALSIRSAVGEAEEEDLGNLQGLKHALRLAGTLIVFGFLAGVGETAMQSLLPLYGLAYGLDDANSSYLVAIFSLGEAVLVAVLGWLADRYGRTFTLKLCTFLSVVVMVALPFTMDIPFARAIVLFIAGGTISGLYTLGVILIGHDFRGSRLAIVSTGFAMAYSAGSIVGSTPVGAAIDLLGPEALPGSIALGFLITGIFMMRPRSSVADSVDEEGEEGMTADKQNIGMKDRMLDIAVREILRSGDDTPAGRQRVYEQMWEVIWENSRNPDGSANPSRAEPYGIWLDQAAAEIESEFALLELNRLTKG